MPLIAELVTKLKAETSEFNKKMQDSEGKLSQFGKAAAVTGAGIALAIGTVAVAGFVKLLNIVNDTEERISNLVDSAAKFSTTVGGLQKLEYIAKLSGGSLSDVESGLSKLIVSMKRLDQGSKSTVAAFEQLGLSQEKIAGMTVDQVYIRIAEGLQGITDQTQRAKVASEIFGKSWSNQINILNSDITGLSAEFDSFGGTLTQEQAGAVDNYGDSVAKLSALLDVFRLQLTANVAPALEQVVVWIANTTKEMGGLGPVANTVSQYFVSGLQTVVDVAQRVIDVVNGISYAFDSAKLKILEFMQSFSEANFSVLGGDFNFERLDEITRLKDRLAPGFGAQGRVTQPLQQGLQSVQNKLQASAKQTVDVRISTEKGLKAEVAESPEVTAHINKLIEKYAEAST